jgi:hypothetical protein
MLLALGLGALAFGLVTTVTRMQSMSVTCTPFDPHACNLVNTLWRPVCCSLATTIAMLQGADADHTAAFNLTQQPTA